VKRLCALLAMASVSIVAHGQTLTITPQQVYVFECQETFVTLNGTNLTGTASTLVDFVASGGQIFELEPNTAAPDKLEVWIPLPVAYAAGDYSVSVKATDTGSGTRTIGPVTLSVVQRSANAPPLLSLPEVIIADTTSSSGALVSFDAAGASCDHASGSLFPAGTTTVTCSATNAFGTATGIFSVVVTNTSGSPPAFTLPEVIVAEATSAAGAVVSFSATGATCDHASGATYPLGDTTVTCSATNSFGTTTVSMIVAVLDTTAPVLNLPADITSPNHVVNFTATGSDAVDGTIPAVCNPASGSSFPDGTTVVLCTATDAHANSSSGSFMITVIPPTLADFSASQNVFQLNAAAGGSVTYTSSVPLTLTETFTIRSEATGATVRTLFNGVRAAGTYQDVWNGTNDAGQLVGDGAYRYFVTVSAGGSTLTWDDGTHYMGTTVNQFNYPMCRKADGTLTLAGECASAAVFDPYTLKPLSIDYCVGGGDPSPACSDGNTPYVVIGKALNAAETTDPDCHGTDCFLNEYQATGAHEVAWYGTSVDGTFIGNLPYLTIIRRNDIWPRNLTLVYGTAPTISNLTISPLVFNPASTVGAMVGMTVTAFQSRSATVRIAFRNVSSHSILRTITTVSQPPGSVVLSWNGRADNGAWVAPGLYEVLITVTDSAGGAAVLKPVITVRYE
jgi:flagellar hook assembly protein FlgD